MYLDRIYFVGFTSEIRHDDIITPPVAPANYKDPERIRSYVEDRLALLQPLKLLCPGVAMISSVAVFNWHGEPVFNAVKSVESPFTPPAIKFWEWVHSLKHYTNGYTLDLVPEKYVLPDAALRSLTFFGFRIKPFMQISAFEVMMYNEDGKPPKVKLPVQIWHDHYGVCDPYETIFTPEQRKMIGLEQVARLLHGSALDEESLYQRPRVQAMLAHRMVLRGQLMGVDPENYLGQLSHARDPEWPDVEEEDPTNRRPREAGAAPGGQSGLLPAEGVASEHARSPGS